MVFAVSPCGWSGKTPTLTPRFQPLIATAWMAPTPVVLHAMLKIVERMLTYKALLELVQCVGGHSGREQHGFGLAPPYSLSLQLPR